MFKEFFSREVRTALKQPMVYIFLFIITLLVALMTASENGGVGGSIGVIKKNAPHIITILTAIFSIGGLLVATAFFNNAALRDYKNQFNEILFATPLNKAGYFFGRFAGALLLSTIPLLGVFLGVLIGAVLGPLVSWGAAADRFGPVFFKTFLNNYLLFVLPNMLFAGSIIFAMATKWKSTIISFVGTLIVIIGYGASGSLMSDIENETLSALLDPFGIRSYDLTAKYFTPIEKNTLSPAFGGVLLANRLLWMAIGLVILSISYFTFSFKEKTKKAKKTNNKKESTLELFSKPFLTPNYSANWLIFNSFFKLNFLSIIKSATFKILFLFAGIIIFTSLIGGFEYFGLKSFPVTYKMVDTISNSTSLFVMIILVFFSGELIWRDRDSHLNEVIDATPHLSFTSLIAKTLSLVSVTILLHAFFIVIGVFYQLANGYTRLELDLYITSFILRELPNYLLWSGILVLVQVLVNQKYIAYFISILLIFALSIFFQILDVQSNLLNLGNAPSLMYSEMNGFGPGLLGALWFNLYWILFGFLLILVSGLIWNRGVRIGLKNRLAQLRTGFTGSYAIITSAVFIIWVGTASFIFYNTKILNEYDSRDEREAQSVDYETKYSKYKKVKPAKIAEVQYYIDIFPETRSAEIKANIKITNTNEKAIDSLHFTINEDWKHKINIPNSDWTYNDEEIGYQIYVLKTKLQKGDTISMEITANYTPEGFENNRGSTSIIKNGTFFNNFSILPSFGYNEQYEINDKNKRKKLGLIEKARMPKLEEDCGEDCMTNYLTNGISDWVKVETFISTSEDQIAIAPGSKISEEVKDGRRLYHYKVDQPSQNFYSFMSARYDVASRKWNGIDLEVYYDKNHAYNVEMMLDAMQKSLEYYIKNFGPYYHKQARIIEFPRYSTFAQAFPGTMPYSEGFGFIIDLEDEDNNVIDAVIAHEMAHQWWAHQEVGAAVQGGTMLTESFAEYSSLMVMKQNSDPMKMTEFLKYDFNRYLEGRSGERRGENPLYKVENQQYIHYGKGSVVMYALQEYIGEDKVNNALRSFLGSSKYKTPPYPTTYDFLACLEPQVPDSLKYLITDWFKEITLYDFRLKEADYQKVNDEKYLVKIQFEAIKTYSDSIGNNKEQPLNEWVDIGAMTVDDDKILLTVNRIKVDKKEMTYSFETNEKPGKIVIDPKRLLIERVIKDNSKTAEEEE